MAEEQFLTALLEEGRKVIAEKFGEEIDLPELAGPAADDEFIGLAPVESRTLPGRAARRG